jgi:hypothetical protein
MNDLLGIDFFHPAKFSFFIHYFWHFFDDTQYDVPKFVVTCCFAYLLFSSA